MRKFKTFSAVVISIILFQAVSAQVMVKGIVKDNKGNPIAGASISIKDSYDGATSDSLGRYSFKAFEKGPQLLVVSNIGYKSYEQQVKLETGVLTIDVVLKPVTVNGQLLF